jgi:succinyldiaminopimelate transaminase
VRLSERLPDFPWDKLARHAERAAAHSGGIIDLSVGTPVDPTPDVVQAALRAATDNPGYPQTIGLPELRQSMVGWLERSHGVTGLSLPNVLPLIGSKEFIAALPLHLGLGAGDLIVWPALAYPTYEVGAALAGANGLATDALESLGDAKPAIVWINSPSNPTGRVMSVSELRAVVAWCRERGTLLVSDECYIECAWEAEPVSVLHPSVCDGSFAGLLAVHSLSKRSNMAGYRAAFVAGDADVVAELLAVRKNLGLQMPGPQQLAMVAALDDGAHARAQHEVYAARRKILRDAFEGAGFRIDHSEASLYLWATRSEDCWRTVDRLADLGILVAPGDFYGETGEEHVRIAFTVTDERAEMAVERLAAWR